MEQFKVQLVDEYTGNILEDNVDDMVFNSEDEAQDYADEMNSNTAYGAEILKMSNPYEYEEDYGDCEGDRYVVAEID